jgi:hypothetical protein
VSPNELGRVLKRGNKADQILWMKGWKKESAKPSRCLDQKKPESFIFIITIVKE